MNFSFAQNTSDKFYSLNYVWAYNFAPNKSQLNDASLDGYVRGIEISMGKLASGAEWSEAYGYPRIGLTLQFVQMNKPDTFGYCFSFVPNFELRLFDLAKSEINLKFGYGVSLVTKKFDITNNFDNRAISFPLNFATSLGIFYHGKIDDNADINLGIGLHHVSNGSFKIPNGGFNMIQTYLGFNYFLNQCPYNNKKKNNLKIENKDIYIQTYVAVSVREQGTFARIRSYPVATISNSILIRLNQLYSVGIGIDGFYDATQALIGNQTFRYSDVSEKEKFNAAIGFNQQFEVGKLFVPLHVYRYIYDLAVVKQPNYIRFGLGYNFSKNFITGVFFKGSFNGYKKLESDFMEISLGYRFFRG